MTLSSPNSLPRHLGIMIWLHCASSSAFCLLVLHLLPDLTQNLATEMEFPSAWAMICRLETFLLFLSQFWCHPISFLVNPVWFKAVLWGFLVLCCQTPVLNPEWWAGNWHCHLRDPKISIRTVSCCSAPIFCCLSFKTGTFKKSVQKAVRNHPQRQFKRLNLLILPCKTSYTWRFFVV